MSCTFPLLHCPVGPPVRLIRVLAAFPGPSVTLCLPVPVCQAAALLKEELVAWLLEKLSSERQSQPQPQPQPLPLPEDVVLQPHLQGALEALEQRLLQRLAEERQESEKTDAWRTVGETLQREGVGAISVQVGRRSLRHITPRQ